MPFLFKVSLFHFQFYWAEGYISIFVFDLKRNAYFIHQIFFIYNITIKQKISIMHTQHEDILANELMKTALFGALHSLPAHHARHRNGILTLQILLHLTFDLLVNQQPQPTHTEAKQYLRRILVVVSSFQMIYTHLHVYNSKLTNQSQDCISSARSMIG